jgi:hypothetical protein
LRQTPTKPQPEKEKTIDKRDFLHMDKIPPLFPVPGR